MAKVISAGLILTDGTKFLACHSTHNWFFDLPKGTVEFMESPKDACIREVREETGMKVNGNSLIDLGEHQYNDYKTLHLFVQLREDLPSVETLKCNAFSFNQEKKSYFPEADGFRYIDVEEIDNCFTENMCRALREAFEKIKNVYRENTSPQTIMV